MASKQRGFNCGSVGDHWVPGTISELMPFVDAVTSTDIQLLMDFLLIVKIGKALLDMGLMASLEKVHADYAITKVVA